MGETELTQSQTSKADSRASNSTNSNTNEWPMTLQIDQQPSVLSARAALSLRQFA
jgi:hypothetical protein